MARSFITTSDQYLLRSGAVVSAMPFTMSCWFKAASVPDYWFTLMQIANYGATFSSYSMNLGGVLAGNVQKVSACVNFGEGIFDETITSTTWSVGTWHHALVVFQPWGKGANPRLWALLDGSGLTQFDSLVNPTVLSHTGISIFVYGPDLFLGYGTCMNGLIAEAAIWNVALTAAEIPLLAKGYSPLLAKPQNLVAYWPLVRKGSVIDNRDIRGGYNLTDYNTPSDDAHCRIIRPASLSLPAKYPAPPAKIPVFMNHYRRLRAD